MKVTLMPGIESISGSVKQRNGKKLVFRTFRKPSASRGGKPETRAYLMTPQERTTPLSEAEMRQRAKFAKAAKKVKQMSEAERKSLAQEWKEKGYQYNGKKYSTFRGYLLAKVMKECYPSI